MITEAEVLTKDQRRFGLRRGLRHKHRNSDKQRAALIAEIAERLRLLGLG